MKEMYVALTGAVARERHLAVIADNLANAGSVGFKKEMAVFEVMPPRPRLAAMQESASPGLLLPRAEQHFEQTRNYVRLVETVTDFAPGPLRPTDRSLDVALQERPGATARAFFVVETPQGLRFTRMGGLQLNADGEFVTPNGFTVLGTDDSPLQVEEGSIDRLHIDSQGEVSLDGESVGTLQVAIVDRPHLLERIGRGLYGDRSGQVESHTATEDDGVRVRQGHLEMSNVNIVEEMVRMIELQRAYEAQQKTLQAMDEASSRVISQALS